MDENENSNIIDTDTMNWIQSIQHKAGKLMEAAESFEEQAIDFEPQDVRAAFQCLEGIFLELKELLDPESEPEEPKDEDD